MVDTHTHLYVKDFETDLEQVLHDAMAMGASHFFLPAIDAETHQAMLNISETHLGLLYPMIGLHPCSVKGNYEEEMQTIYELMKSHTFYGIGESGLDYYWDLTYQKEQVEVLRLHVMLALENDLPLILHTRNSTDETIRVVEEYKGSGLKGIFHCFGGSLEQANKIIDAGFYLGIGGVVTYKKSGLEDVLRKVPLEKIVLETDAPYLSPVPHRGRRNEPKYMVEVAKKIAEIKSVSFQTVVEATTNNAKHIFAQAFR